MKTIYSSLFALAIAWICWPYYALYNLGWAFRNGDQVSLETRVDWPMLRSGLNDDINAYVVSNTRRMDSSGTAFAAGLATLLGPAVISRGLDAYVTPSNIAKLISDANKQGGLSERVAALDFRNIRYAFFSGLNTFRFDLKTHTDSATITGIMKWDGDWKLVRIIAPFDLIETSVSAKGAQSINKSGESSYKKSNTQTLDNLIESTQQNKAMPPSVPRQVPQFGNQNNTSPQN
jgi:hypothetical protein